MPLDLPPTVLPQAYAQAEQALGPSATAVRLSVAGPLPAGLAAALRRHNPDLAAQLARHPDLATTDPVRTLTLLGQSDRTVLDALHRQGWLTDPVHNQVGQGLDAATAAFWATGDQRDMTVVLDRGVLNEFNALAPIPASVDRVALRWFALLHEAAHTQMNHLDRAFADPAWSAQANAAMNHLVFLAPGMTDHPIALRPVGVFRESFADAYGALMAVRLTQNDPGMREVLRYVAQARQAGADARWKTITQSGVDLPASHVIFYDEHATADTLGPLVADLDAGKLQDLARATPEQLQALAQRYASEGLVRWLTGREGVDAVNTFGWAHGVMSWQAVDNTFNAGPFVEAERLRALRFIGTRAQAFARADAQGQSPGAITEQAGPNPVLADLIARDAARFADFQRLPATDRATYAAQLRHPDPEAMVPVAIQNWANHDTALADAQTFRPAFRDAIVAALSPLQLAAARQVVDPSVRQAAETQRLADYVEGRMAAYAAAARHGTLRPAEAQADPVLGALATTDALWQARYQALPAAERATVWRQRTEVTDSPDATPTPAYTALVLAMRQAGQVALSDPTRRRALDRQMESDFRTVSQALGQVVGAPAVAQVPFPSTVVTAPRSPRRPGR